jgi:hypothetical protein
MVYDLFAGNDGAARENTYDLTALLTSGQARPVYGEWADNKGNRGIAVSRAVTGPNGREQGGYPSKFIFEFDNKVLSVGGAYLKGFTEMGAVVAVPANYDPHAVRDPIRGAGNFPLISIRVSDTVIGLLAPMSDTGIDETPDGRPLYRDASSICWKSTDHALSLIDSDTSLFDPRKVDQHETCVSTIVEDAGTWTTAAEAVGILRWRGAEEHEIADLIRKRRYDAWCRLYNHALGEVQRVVEADLKTAADRLESKGPAAAKWQISALKSRTEALCDRIEELSHLMETLGGDGGGDRDIGLLPELVSSVETLEMACGS